MYIASNFPTTRIRHLNGFSTTTIEEFKKANMTFFTLKVLLATEGLLDCLVAHIFTALSGLLEIMHPCLVTSHKVRKRSLA